MQCVYHNLILQALTGHDEKERGMKDKSDVRLQWDPDHLPNGESHKRRAIQLGMRNKVCCLSGGICRAILQKTSNFISVTSCSAI